MATPSTTYDLLDADTLNADAASGWRNLVRNPYFQAWVGDRPCYWGLPSAATLPATAPAKDTTTGQGYRGGAALLWTAAGGDAANAMLTDLGGIVAYTRGAASLHGSWPGLTVVVRCKTSTGSLVRARITHNAVDYVSGYHTGGGAWEDLAVTLPASVAYTLGQSLEVGFETAGATAGTVYVDHVQASFGEWQPGPLLGRPSVLRAELGSVQASWTRRQEGGLQAVCVRDLDGVVRTGGIELDFDPSWLTLCGVALPNVVGMFHSAHTTGTNSWSIAQLRAITGSGYDPATGTVTVLPIASTTFAAAGTNLRSSFLFLVEPTVGGEAYPND